jgi:hypothetical protein
VPHSGIEELRARLVLEELRRLFGDEELEKVLESSREGV